MMQKILEWKLSVKYIYFSKLKETRQIQNAVTNVNVLGKRIKLSACKGYALEADDVRS